MGKLLIFTILLVTIPRWAMTLYQVDQFGITIAGNTIALAAIGEALVLEFGNLFVLGIFNRCHRYDTEYHAKWKALDKQNKEAARPKTTRKLSHDPRISKYKILPLMLLALEMLTFLAQTPFVAGALLGRPAIELLRDWGMWAVWGYASLLVVSPGIMTIAIGTANSYETIMKVIEAEQAKRPQRLPLRDQIMTLLSARLPVADQWTTTGQPLVEPLGGNGRPQAPTGRPVADHARPVAAHSATMAEHLRRLADQLDGQFSRQDVQTTLGISRSHALNVIHAGLASDVLTQPRRHRYAFAGNGTEGVE